MIRSSEFRYSDYRVGQYSLPSQIEPLTRARFDYRQSRFLHVGPQLIWVDRVGGALVEVGPSPDTADWVRRPGQVSHWGRGWNQDFAFGSGTDIRRFAPGTDPTVLLDGGDDLRGIFLLRDGFVVERRRRTDETVLTFYDDGLASIWNLAIDAHEIMVSEDSLLVFEISNEALSCVDQQTGSRRWRVRLANEPDRFQSLVGIVDGVLWLEVEWPRALLGLDLETGDRVGRLEHEMLGASCVLDDKGRAHYFSGITYLILNLASQGVEMSVSGIHTRENQRVEPGPAESIALVDGRLVCFHNSFGVFELRPDQPDVAELVWDNEEPIRTAGIARDRLHVMTGSGELIVLG